MTVPVDAHAPLRCALVVGTGLIGTSVALALTARGVRVHLDDRDDAARRQAAQLGAGTPQDPDGPVDLAVLAVPPAAVGPTLARVQESGLALTCTDVASIKAGPQRAVEAGGDPTSFVGGHPLAGRERSGPGAARSDLFTGRPWVLTPSRHSGEEHLARALRLVELCGGLPVLMDAAEHDRAVALVSHAPHVAASLVAARLADAADTAPGAVQLSGPGIRDITRVAGSDPELWAGILAGNAGPVAAVLRALRTDLDAVLAALDGPDGRPGAPGPPPAAESALRELLAAGVRGRAAIPGKHGTEPTAYAGVPVVVPDQPGALARLFADTAAAGVNVEDVRIEHSPGQPVGLVEIAVRPAAADRLAAALGDRGWTVHR